MIQVKNTSATSYSVHAALRTHTVLHAPLFFFFLFFPPSTRAPPAHSAPHSPIRKRETQNSKQAYNILNPTSRTAC